jgi:teichuronic acid exporter
LRREEAASLLANAWPISIEHTLGTVGTRGFILLFGFFHGLHDLGLLNFAVRLVDEIGSLVTVTIQRVSLAFFASLHRAGQNITDAFLNGTHGLTLLCAPVFLGFAAVSGDLVRLVFGEKWVEAVPAIAIFSIIWAIRSTRLLAPAVITTLGAQRLLVWNAILSVPTVLLAAVLTANASFLVAAAAYHAGMLATYPRGLVNMRNAAGISVRRQLESVAVPLLCAGAMAAIVIASMHFVFTDAGSLARLVAGIIIGVSVYGVLVLVTDSTRARQLVTTLQRA